MASKEQKLVELGYEVNSEAEIANKDIKYNERLYTITIFTWCSINKMTIIPDCGFKTQQDIDDLQIVFNRTQDELRKAGILE